MYVSLKESHWFDSPLKGGIFNGGNFIILLRPLFEVLDTLSTLSLFSKYSNKD